MNLTFNSSHLDTLTKLKALADKNNCVIVFGINQFPVNLDADLEKIKCFNAETIRLLYDNEAYPFIIDDQHETNEEIWFQLTDKTNMSNHLLSYQNYKFLIAVDEDWKGVLDNVYETIDEIRNSSFNDNLSENKNNEIKELDRRLLLIDEFKDWMNQNVTEYNYIEYENNPTLIQGFGNKESIRDYRVYRPGMALHFFTELVCKYLNEPTIENVY